MSGHAVALSATRRRRAHKIRPPARDRCGGLPRRDHPIGADTTPVRLPFRLLLGVARLPVSARSPNSDRNVFVHDGIERIVMYARDWTPRATATPDAFAANAGHPGQPSQPAAGPGLVRLAPWRRWDSLCDSFTARVNTVAIDERTVLTAAIEARACRRREERNNRNRRREMTTTTAATHIAG